MAGIFSTVDSEKPAKKNSTCGPKILPMKPLVRGPKEKPMPRAAATWPWTRPCWPGSDCSKAILRIDSANIASVTPRIVNAPRNTTGDSINKWAKTAMTMDAAEAVTINTPELK